MQEPSRGDDGAGGKYPSLLEDFQTGAASMARKRHLASTARGFYCFCLMAQIGVQGVQGVQAFFAMFVLWHTGPIRLIRPIRVKKESRGQVFIYVYRLAMDARTLEGVMVWVAENIQACLRIFRRAQHLWLVRDILHQAQGVFYVFVSWFTGTY